MVTRRFLVCGCGVALLLASGGCPSIGNESGTCETGDTCTCDVIGNCEWSCPGGKCHFKCEGTGNCLFTCDGGGCDLECSNTGNCILACPGDDCTIACHGTGNCILNKCTQGCASDGSPDRRRDSRTDLPRPRDARRDTIRDGGPLSPDSCVPSTCTQLGKNCGMTDNGCGTAISCSTCSSGSCGGGGTPGVCSCPTTGTEGAKSPIVGANNTLIGQVPWTNPGEITSANGGSGSSPTGVASAHLWSGHSPSNYLFATGFGFAVPTNAVINGVQVEIRRRTRNAGSTSIADHEVRLVRGGAVLTNNRAASAPWPDAWIYAQYGGNKDLWGRLWTPAEVNDPAFGVALAAKWTGTAGNDEAFVDHITVAVTYAAGCCVPTTCLAKGYKCGPLEDGCGTTLQCGNCPIGDHCVSGQCCTPKTCASQGYKCGTVSDGCGNTLPCGSCAPGDTCVLGQCNCTNGTKDTPEADVDCGGVCLTKCAQGKSCSATTDCTPPYSCADNVCCSSTCAGVCRGCVSSKTGTTTGICANITDSTDPDGDCATDPVATCKQTGSCKAGACELYASGTVCAAAYCSSSVEYKLDACDGLGVCVDGGSTTCTPPYVCSGTTCQGCSDSTKNGNETDVDCGGGTCPACGQGKKCVASTDCSSGNCVDGVCCNNACAGLCVRCDLTGTVGTCSQIQNADPDNECAGPKLCVNGACSN